MLQIGIFVLLAIALLIPITAILVDSPLGRSLARRMETGPGAAPAADTRVLQQKIEVLETEVEELSRSLAATREELQFVQRLLEKPKSPPAA